MELTQHQADAFARMPLTYLRQEYPNHIMHLLNDDGDVLPPRELHPIFYGCFDWHSAVHGYWLLLRCVRLYPELPCRDAIVALFDEHLTEENVAKELAYFTAPFRASFERPYGYGWLLALAQELKQSSLPGTRRWSRSPRTFATGWWITSASSPIRSASGRTTTPRLPSRWRSITVAQSETRRLNRRLWQRRSGFISPTRAIRLIMSPAETSIFPAR